MQLVQVVRDSAIRKAILLRQMKLIQVVLVFQRPRCRMRDALRAVVRVRVRVAVYSVTVHFRAKSDELGDLLAGRLILELADNLLTNEIIIMIYTCQYFFKLISYQFKVKIL